jgi:hypothetical protein
MKKAPSPHTEHARPVGSGELGAQNSGDPEAHGSESHRADQRIRPARFGVTEQPVVMHADVAHQDGVLRKTAADLNGGTLRIDRLAVIAEAWGDQLVPFLSVAVDGLEPLPPRVGALAKIGPPVQFGVQLAQEGTHIGHQTERDRVVAANLLGIDVDMNEFGRGNGERIARNPRTRGPVVEAHAERQQDVGLARRVVRLVVPAACHQPQCQGMMGVNGAEAAGRCGHRNLQAFRQPQQFSAGTAPAHTLSNENDGPLGGKEHVDGLDHAFRIGAATARNVGVPFFRFRRLLGGCFHEHIERHVKHHRSRLPVTMVFHAWRTASGTISPRVGWNTRLQ